MTIKFDEESDIWLKAVENWKSRTGTDFDVKHFSGMSMDDMRNESQSDLEMFEKSRHGKSPELNSVRVAFAKHISDIKNVLQIFQAAASMAAVSPLTM